MTEIDAKTALELAERISKSMAEGYEKIYTTAENFGEIAPGKQCSILGFLLIALACVGEGLDIFWFLETDVMENEVSLALLAFGSFLTVSGSVITGYFLLRRLDELHKQAEAIEKTTNSIFKTILPNR